MRIAEITPVFSPYKGGIGMVAFHNAQILAKAGHEVSVFTPRYASLKNVAAKETIDGCLVVRLKPLLQYGNAAFLSSLCGVLRGFNAFHLHYPFLGGAELVILAKILFKKRLVVTYHMDLIGHGFFKNMFTVYSRIMIPFIVKYADGIFVTSFDYAGQSLLAPFLTTQSEKFKELPITVDTNHFKPDVVPDEIKKRHALSSDERVILFVGGLDSAHYFKGVTYLIDAAALLMRRDDVPRFRVLIIGEGDLRPSYEQYAKEAGVSENIIFVGTISNDDLPAYYRSADVSVLPSIDSSEAFGLVLIEAMACGTPVIASDLRGVRSVVGRGTGILVPPKDTKQLAEALVAIISDPQRAKVMGENARAHVLERYSHEKASFVLRSAFL
ncbi:MAG: glycosyltransferase family 4 protein [bacterium]|nr:glycosyltransferase family 4 protein [bacterium]